MKSLWIFLSGVAVGAVGSMVYIKKFVIPALRTELEKEKSEEIPDLEMENVKKPEEDESEWVTVTDSEAKERVKEIQKEKQYLDYSKFSGTVTSVSGAVTPEAEKGKETMTVVSDEEQTEPYIIDEESFDEFSGYRAITFEVYSDGVIIDDESEEELDADPELVFGKIAMDTLEKEPTGVICVRDDSKKCDYRLERKDYPANGPMIDILYDAPEIDLEN